MNKNQFIDELRIRLKRLPAEEVENAVNYYEEYFNDAGAENEKETIAALGSPLSVASKIIGEYAVVSAENTTQKRTSPLLIVLLAICASPIALPIGLSLIVIVIALMIVFVAILVSFVAVVVAGVIYIIAGFWAFAFGFATGLFYLGTGLLLLALGVAVCILILKAGRTVFRGLQRWLGKLLIRRGTK